MSNLLKRELKPDAAAFGFPVIQKEPGAEAVVLIDTAPRPAEPEVSAEELYRRKLLETERHAQEIERDAYSRGFAQGEKDGLDYGQKSVNVVRAQLEHIAKNLEALPGKVLHDYRDWLIRASITIARQIVKKEIRTSPEIVADRVDALIEEAEEHSTLTVYVNPNDLEIVEKRAGSSKWAGGKRFSLKADRELERGGCRIESAIQLLDASIACMFENLEKKLVDQ